MSGTTENRGDLADRLRFLGLDASAAEVLRKGRDILGQALPDAVDRFYDHLVQWPSMMALFQDPSRRKYARDSQVKHWEVLFTGKFDEDYMKSVRRIGATHARIGLEARWFIGAYGQIVGALQEACLKAMAPKTTKNPAALQELSTLMRAVVLATNLDMDLVIEVYQQESHLRHRAQMEELSLKFRTSVANSLSRASSDLGASASQIRASADQAVVQGRAVDEAARAAHLSVESIAAALEEVARSVIEIRGQTERSTRVASDAVSRTREINKVMTDLSSAVARIDDSVALINDIAERTNILAINASIEAARAGNVGKGFAVVAAEVRNLASQTVDATQAISSQIQTLKEASHQSTASVAGIVEVMGTIDKTTVAIAGAVDEQGTVTQETAREALTAAEQSIAVTRVIEQVTKGAEETGKVAANLQDVLKRMAGEFESLNLQVDEFLKQIE